MQDLHDVLMKLRDEFNYCLFCGCKVSKRKIDLYVFRCLVVTQNCFQMVLKDGIAYPIPIKNPLTSFLDCVFFLSLFLQYESRDALLSNCPGTDEDDH